MDNLTKVFWKNEAVRLNKELDNEKAKFDKLKELFNPDKAFPLDIFPDISKEELEDLDILLRTKKSFPLDRLSAFIGRKHYKNFIDELSSKEGKDE
jgi:exopolysaccharide biosynthesis predicted pyruvyltransferase EpsI